MAPWRAALLDVLTSGERRALLGSSFALFVERIAVVASVVWASEYGVRAAWGIAALLSITFFARAALFGGLRVAVRAQLLRAVVASVLLDQRGDAPAAEALPVLDGIDASEEIVGSLLPGLGGDVAASALFALAAISLEPPRLVLEGGLAVGVGGACLLFARRATALSSERQWRLLLPALASVETAIGGRVEIGANGRVASFLAGHSAAIARWRAAALSGARVSFLAGRAPMLAAAVVVGLVLIAEDRSMSGAFTRAAVLASAVPAFAGVVKGALDLTRALVRARSVVTWLERPVSPQASPLAVPPVLNGAWWRGVSFTYPGAARPSLDAVDATFTAGELLAVAGPNGSGKSTFLQLLLGWDARLTGSLDVSGIPPEAIRSGALREAAAFLSQRPFLPDRETIAEAIALLAPHATPHAMEHVLRRVGLWPVLLRRAGDSPLDVKLGSLSAGEKQRVAIARVLLRDAPLLLLDEPDANLDSEGVGLIGEILREESKKRMVLFAAHDSSLLGIADRVIWFADGRVEQREAQRSVTTGHPDAGPGGPIVTRSGAP